MVSTVDHWTPPPGMLRSVVIAWRAFYRRGLSGEAGYTITPAQYRSLYVAQKGRCWICRKARGIHPDDPKGGGSRRLGVDHDHRTGEVRGLLCSGGDKTCNRIIGWLNSDALDRAAAYLCWRGAQPARVLAELDAQVASAEAEGVQLSQVQLDALGVAFLWPGDDMPIGVRRHG